MSTLAAAAVVILLAVTLSAAPGEAAPKERSPEAPWSVSFHDGSGNAVRVTKESPRARARFEFFPVQPESSSTGFYSGGRPKKGRIDAAHTRELWRRLRRLEGEKALHTEHRDKGTGAFQLKTPDGERSFILQDGAALRDFVAWLQADVVGRESYKPTLLAPRP